VLTSNVTDLGDGLFAYDLVIDGQDGEYASYFAQDFTFTGNFASFTRYPDAEDLTASYLQSPWDGNRLGPAVQSPGSYKFNAGTGGGSKYLSLPLARVVVAGELTITGQLARNAVMYSFNGTFSTGSSFSTLQSTLDPAYAVAPIPVSPDPVGVPPLTPEVPAVTPELPFDPPTPVIPTDPTTPPPSVFPPVFDPIVPVTEIPAGDPPGVPETPTQLPQTGEGEFYVMPAFENTDPQLINWPIEHTVFVHTGDGTGIFSDSPGLVIADVDAPFVLGGPRNQGTAWDDRLFVITNAGAGSNLVVPEPATWSLAGAALATLAILRLSRCRRSSRA
jgi:hypothetical protein